MYMWNKNANVQTFFKDRKGHDHLQACDEIMTFNLFLYNVCTFFLKLFTD